MTADQLEIAIDRREVDAYRVEMRFSSPDNETDALTVAPAVRFDFAALRENLNDPDAYGRLLSESLFESPEVLAAFVQAQSVAAEHDRPLQVRLYVEPSSPELHELRWETLRDPRTGERVVTRERLLFSRYLACGEWQRVQLRPRGDIKALVLVAAPSDIQSYQPNGQPLAPVNAGAEVARVTASLGTIPVTSLVGPGQATLDALRTKLRTETYDILCVVCHGALVREKTRPKEGAVVRRKPVLYLETEAGATAEVAGAEFAARLAEVGVLPRLVVLVSCQSAGTADEGMMAALGPLLARHGFPAVVAMQGNVTVTTAGAFLGEFFRVLREPRGGGQIDRAMAAGRAKVRDRPDHWAPTLFLRLKGGNLWYVPGFVGSGNEEFDWAPLLNHVENGQCTPILGAGLLDRYVGRTRDIARRLAEEHHYPLAPHSRDDLPQVMQYLAVRGGTDHPVAELRKLIRRDLQDRFGIAGGPERPGIMDAAFREAARANPASLAPFNVLATLPIPVYVTTTPDNLLFEALATVAPTRKAEQEFARWKPDDPPDAEDGLHWPEALDVRDPGYEPTPDRPLVYHLFGSFSVPNSVVTTEDDYFEYLMSTGRKESEHPVFVRRRLVNSVLVFLGFDLDDWSFRVMFRNLMAIRGKNTQRQKRYPHVAVQINPDEDRILQPSRARRYIEDFVSQDVRISVYWGTAEEFLTELGARWADRAAALRPPAPAPGREAVT
jgi:hypothetical protein